MNVVFRDPKPLIGRFSRERGFPENYFIFDLETSGFSRDNDVITQVGWAIVRDRQIVDNQALTLNWTRYAGMDQMWLEHRLVDVADAFRRQGKPYHLTYQALAASPHDPLDVLTVLLTLLDDTVAADEWIVGHNLAIFDTGVVDAHCRRFLKRKPVAWRPNRIFDTGLFLKAAQLGRYPSPMETLAEFFRAVAGVRAKGVKWALDKYCIPAFGLDTRFGVDVQKCHDGGYDCKVNYHLFEAMREIGEAHGQKECETQGRLF